MRARRRRSTGGYRQIIDRREILPSRGFQAHPKPRCRVAPSARGTAPMDIGTLHVVATSEPVAELERLGEEIAELSANLDAATARLLELIREFDARAGWNHGSRSCAHWLNWRVG